MVSAKLNHLHILFLLQLGLSRRVSEPNDELVNISASMLGIVVEATLHKSRLANSGTGLVWKESRCPR